MDKKVYIENYTMKSFVVRGETIDHKETLKLLGGKWNNSLTDKKTGEKFGAWIFWNGDKNQELEKVENWIKNGCKPFCSDDKNLEIKIDKLSKQIEHLTKLLENNKEEDYNEEEFFVKPKRLLKD